MGVARREHSDKRSESRSAKERMLDAAEQLFARHGFDGVSVRDITKAAGVDVALISYHFGGKRELFTAVFQRRAEILNVERLALLDHVRRAALPGVPALEEIVNAFTHPLLERSARGGPGWKSYFALVALVNNSPEWGPVLMTEHFDAIVEKFIAVLREALPDCPPQEIYWGYQFLTGALTLTFAETGRIDKLSGGLCRSSDLDSVHQRLALYVAAGFRALNVAAIARNTKGVRTKPAVPTAKPAQSAGSPPTLPVATAASAAAASVASVARPARTKARRRLIHRKPIGRR
jgi:AcrR family transcriptional regulator